MNENDGLQILIEAALDFEKSLTTMTAQMNQLQEKFKSYQIKITAGLNQTASAAQIKKDLKQINAAKNHVRLVGQMDQDATKKNVAGTVKKLKNTEVQLTGLLDTASTQKNVQEQLQQLRQIPQVEAKANVSVEGAEQVDQLSQKMDKASNSASNMAAKVYLARTALQALRRAAQEAKDTVVELDKAATDLAIVTGSGSEEAYVLLKEYNQMAQQLGATTTQISDAAAEWLRQGKTAAETATLIEQSMILSKVGAMESATATQNLTSAMKGYGMAVEDVSRIVDKLTAIDLKAAVTASDLAVAMSRTANSANISGVSMDRLLGYLATVEEVTQKSAETIGESFKTIFARMGNIKLGNYLDDDGEDLSDVETVLKSFGIALRGVDGDFRNFAEVLDDVYAKWEQFGAIDKRAIANAFAGTRQQENFLVLMENYGNALEYAGVAADSAGTALEKFSAYEDSIGAKAASFTAALESLTILNTAAWKENANAKMLGEMDEIQKEIDSLQERNTALQESIAYYEEQRNLGNDGGLWSSMIASSTAEIKKNNEAIAENQGKLAIYSSLYGSITGDLDAYTAALSNFSNVSSTIDFISSSFQTLADLQAEVANGFTMSLEKAMEFAAVYPEILNSAQATADGQIALNEGVVNSFIQGKQAELDTEIDSRVAVLEARKAVREAQLAFSQSELDLAKSVGEGESQIAKEVAEYRLDTANQLVAALIEAGVDEATAFQLACTAMAGNTEEFDRIAMEVCTDVNDNFNQAAYGCAQAIYQNMNSAKRDVASLATQAQQTADAIAGMANGVKAGSSAVAGGSGGGSLDSGISLNLSGANFQGTDYSYEAKSISLDDFISDLELDISNYQSAISQIDGQIAALQALKNLPLKSFQSDTGSGGSSSSSTDAGDVQAEALGVSHVSLDIHLTILLCFMMCGGIVAPPLALVFLCDSFKKLVPHFDDSLVYCYIRYSNLGGNLALRISDGNKLQDSLVGGVSAVSKPRQINRSNDS